MANAKIALRHANQVSPLDSDWLEDFANLAETGNFSRAAEARHVTQPAFSRRIRALENWVGVDLFSRDAKGVSLTPAGVEFRDGVGDVLQGLDQLRERAREVAGRSTITLRFAATHALSFSFFPRWIAEQGADFPAGPIELISDSQDACEQIIQRGHAQFMLCYHSPAAGSRLEASRFSSLVVGREQLVPVCAPADVERAISRLPGTRERPVPHLGYRPESGLGRIIEAEHAKAGQAPFLDTVFTTRLAATLLSMARSGHGVGWVPLTLAAGDLASGELVLAGDPSWTIPIEIRVLRPRQKLNRVAEEFWQGLAASGSPGALQDI